MNIDEGDVEEDEDVDGRRWRKQQIFLKKIVIYPCDVAYGSVHMEMPHVHITAMSQGLTTQTNEEGNWLRFDNFMRGFEVS